MPFGHFKITEVHRHIVKRLTITFKLILLPQGFWV